METENLAGEEQARVREMSRDLDAWMGSVIDSLNGKDYQ